MPALNEMSNDTLWTLFILGPIVLLAIGMIIGITAERSTFKRFILKESGGSKLLAPIEGEMSIQAAVKMRIVNGKIKDLNAVGNSAEEVEKSSPSG